MFKTRNTVLWGFGILSAFAFNVQGAELQDLSLIDFSRGGSQFSRLSQLRVDGSKDLSSSLATVLGSTPHDSFQETRRAEDGGIQHYRFQQLFMGVPIWPQELRVALKDGALRRMDGTLVRDIDRDVSTVKPRHNSERAAAIAQRAFFVSNKDVKRSSWVVENLTSDLRVYVHEKRGRLVHVVTFLADTKEGGNIHRPTYVVDAKSGKILHHFDGITFATGKGPGGNAKTGRYVYGVDYPEFEVTQVDSTCKMETAGVKTVNLSHRTTGTTIHSFVCPENTATEVNGAYSPLNDAHYFAHVLLAMWQEWYQIHPLNRVLMMRVHYSSSYENAFWNGTSMTFGDGATRFYPLVSLDVTAHEVAHGFTEFNSALVYSGQSGGINEAFSDMAGEAAEFYMKGRNDFMVGADIFKSATGALRYMDDPPRDRRSIGHVSQFQARMDVHYSSGIYNKAFYLLSNTADWNIRKAFDVFVKANRSYWTRTTNFESGAVGAKSAAIDLGYDPAAVVAAFAQVGITVP